MTDFEFVTSSLALLRLYFSVEKLDYLYNNFKRRTLFRIKILSGLKGD